MTFIAAMSDQRTREINERIAVGLGYKKLAGNWVDPDGDMIIDVPNFWEDLNDCQYISDYLPQYRIHDYLHALAECAHGGPLPHCFQANPMEIIFAPPECRAEAMLRILSPEQNN
jgi:hypothetical protein